MDGDCTPVQVNLFEAFGGIEASWGNSNNNRLANTKERDNSTGLDNHGFRYYDASIGRYFSNDPIGYRGGFNLYVHCTNDPVNKFDPLGLNGVARAPAPVYRPNLVVITNVRPLQPTSSNMADAPQQPRTGIIITPNTTRQEVYQIYKNAGYCHTEAAAMSIMAEGEAGKLAQNEYVKKMSGAHRASLDRRAEVVGGSSEGTQIESSGITTNNIRCMSSKEMQQQQETFKQGETYDKIRAQVEVETPHDNGHSLVSSEGSIEQIRAEKIDNITKERYTEAEIKAARQRGVNRAKSAEQELVQNGHPGTADDGGWSWAERKQIAETGQYPSDTRWHHINDVKRNPEEADNPDNIIPSRGDNAGHVEKYHPNGTRAGSSGEMLNREALQKELIDKDKDK